MIANKEEIKHFLETTEFTTYQQIVLPHGLEIPGKDHSPKIEAIFGSNVDGKSVLDVGCYYGLYSHEAKKRGATQVVGVELNNERYAIAKEIAKLMDDGVDIIQGDIMDVELGSKFDLVIFLSVLHHVKDPIAVIQRLANFCSDTVIVEFCTTDHRLKRKGHHKKTEDGVGGEFREKLDHLYRKTLVNLIGDSVGLILTGDVIEEEQGYDWTFFFNTTAFRTLFQIQNKFFNEIEFLPSPQKANRMLAFCKVKGTK
ncbi:methyltransferase domain-containing protein [bacterium]|jgi:2-polyprenyl-3-methyl-5-hydroxy-6-metoxy-1,4-benzoquinol methylase|nr:methyltransferase domain-containing protein [bacterium]